MGNKRKKSGDRRRPGKNGSEGNGTNMRACRYDDAAYADDGNSFKIVDKDSSNSSLDLLENPTPDLPLPMSKRRRRSPGDSGDKSSCKNLNSEGYSPNIHLHGESDILLRSKRENDNESPGNLDYEICLKDVIKEGMEDGNINMESVEPKASHVNRSSGEVKSKKTPSFQRHVIEIASRTPLMSTSLSDITEGHLPNPRPNGPRAPPPPDHLDNNFLV